MIAREREKRKIAPTLSQFCFRNGQITCFSLAELNRSPTLIIGGRKNKHTSEPKQFDTIFSHFRIWGSGAKYKNEKNVIIILVNKCLDIFSDVVGKILVVKSKILLNEYQIVPGIYNLQFSRK